MVTPASLAAEEFRVRLGALLRAVRAAAIRHAARTAALRSPELAGVVITDQHAGVLLERAERRSAEGPDRGPGAVLDDGELAALREIRQRARSVGAELPGDRLRAAGLDDTAIDLLLLAAAPDIEPSVGGVLGYLADAIETRRLTERVAIDVLATDDDHAMRIAVQCRELGRLVGDGWLRRVPDDGGALVPAPGVVELLRGASVDVALIADRPVPNASSVIPANVDAGSLQQIAGAFGRGDVDVVAVWGADGSGRDAVAAVITSGAPTVHAGLRDLASSLQRAAIAGGCCVVELGDDIEPGALDPLARSCVPVVLVGSTPVRDRRLWVRRRYAEIDVAAPTFSETKAAWRHHFSVEDAARIDDLAARFRLLPDDVGAVAALDRSARRWADDGSLPSIERLAATVTRRGASRLASIRRPTRTIDMLVLPDTHLAQVERIAASFRSWPRIAEAWELDRLGNPGVTALFAGASGTGKTLAAEVIAGQVGVDLMVVDLSKLVSKWIGETEKHLDMVFEEAEATNRVLFFDEADSIFGARGEVSRGADRYANLEVGYLLQRLEQYRGLVVLASNLRGNLDDAFTRRFHHVVHFPVPDVTGRRRIWELLLSAPVVVDGEVDLETLAELDLTGAGIASVVRSAALAAHADGRGAIEAADVTEAVSQQYQREARLPPADLLAVLARSR